MDHCVCPAAPFELGGRVSVWCRERKVKAVWRKHESTLKSVYKGFSAMGQELADEGGGGQNGGGQNGGGNGGEGGEGGGGKGDDEQSLDLRELLLMLKGCNLLDQRMTARKATAFFVQVNVDDELVDTAALLKLAGAPPATPAASLRDSAQCEYEEWLEVLARVCNEKVPEPRSEPFHETLSSWLSLFFLPAVRTLAKAHQIALK